MTNKTQDELILDDSIQLAASDSSCQDWMRLEYKKIHREGFINGAEYLKSELVELRKKNAELEQASDTLHKLMVSAEKRGVAKATEDYENNQAIRDLEQQLKSLDWVFSKSGLTFSNSECQIFFIKMADLREQAKKLREQGR